MKTEETYLEINLNALKNNILFLKSHLKPTTQFLAVVKASAYGLEAAPLAKYIEQHALADYLAVAYTSEGKILRQAGINMPILVLHPQIAHFYEIIQLNLEPLLYSRRIFSSFIEYAKEQKLHSFPIHLKCNTGLNRLGFSLTEIDFVLSEVIPHEVLRIKSVMSHLAASEDLSEQTFTLSQIKNFKEFQKKINQQLPYKVTYHICNTSGILNYPEAQFDMVRSGIGMYGFANDSLWQKKLIPVASLKSIISQIHTLKKGDSIGYNRSYIAQKTTRTATIPIGHADGINRIYGKEKGFVFINNQKVFVIGNVCMDMLMVDVSEVDCNEGDEVIIFDKNHTAEQLAENAGTISYELMTSMSHRIKRIYVEK